MNFISFAYLVFLFITYIIYWGLQKNLKVQNIFVLIANYVFYGWWDFRFLLLIFACATFDYFIGIQIYKSEPKRKKWFLNFSLLLNIGVLFVCKYYNFFVSSFQDALLRAGIHSSNYTLNIILPVGLSFFTFQTLSYSLDLYKGKIKPTTNYVVFLSFTSFFPQLLAGPIERAGQLIPQLLNKRVFSYQQSVDGVRQITYGIFKKTCIADHLSLYVNDVFATYQHAGTGELFKGMVFFLIQLYTDFSGYSDIAIGTGKLFGFRLVTNFKTPFFAKNIPEAWARWHLSLTGWFRDYVYIPLARKNTKSTAWKIFCTLLLFALIGLWHGANFTFIFFGLVNGVYYIPKLLSKNSETLKQILTFLRTNAILSRVSIGFTFLLIALTTVFFRSPTLSVAFTFYQRLFLFRGISWPEKITVEWTLMLLAFFAFEWIQQDKKHQFDISGFYKPIRVAIQLSIMVFILYFGFFGDVPFYYFKF